MASTAGTRVATTATSPDDSPEAGRGGVWAVVTAVAVALITLAVYFPVTRNDFLPFDDDQAVYANPHIADPGYFWAHGYFRLYTPVTYDIFCIVAALFRMPTKVPMPNGSTSDIPALPFHATNLLFHVVNAVLVFVLLRMLLPKAKTVVRELAAGTGALVFALFPMQVEVVAWVNAANNLFATFFSLIALICYVQYVRLAGPKGDGQGSSVWFAAATAAYTLAVLAKPTAVALPLMAWALDYGILGRPLRQSSRLLVWAAIAVAMVPITISAQPVESSIQPTKLWFRPFIAGESLSFYLEKLVAPVGLGVDYGLNPHYMRAHTAWQAWWIIPVALAATVYWRRREWPIVVACSVIWAAWVLPTSGLVPSYFHEISVVADRYVYLSMLGPALGIAWLATRWRAPVFAASVVLLGFWGYETVVQEGYWTSLQPLMQHSVDVSPNGWFGQTNLATWEDRHGDAVDALPHAEAVIRLNPDYATGYFNLGVLLLELNRTDEAAAAFEESAQRDTPILEGNRMAVGSEYISDRMHLATIAMQKNDRDEAIKQLQDVLSYAPGMPAAENGLNTLMALPADPASAMADLARSAWNGGDRAKAISMLQSALQKYPNSSRVHSDLGVALGQEGRMQDALKEFQEAVRLTPNDEVDRRNLGEVLIATNSRAAGIAELKEAVRLNPGDKDSQQALSVAMGSGN